MAAVWRTKSFRHLVNLYEPTEPEYSAGHKATTPPTFTLRYSNVPCRFAYTDNVDDPIDGMGLGKRPSLFTIDHIILAPDQEVGDRWGFRDVSLMADGVTHNINYGREFIAQGEPNIKEDAGARKGGRARLKLFSPPAPLVIV